MNKNDLLYYAINNYFAIQTMNSFCKEAIKGTDIQDSQKRLLDMYSNLIPLFNIETEHIEDLCDKLTLISRMNINCLITSVSTNLDIDEQQEFEEKAYMLINKHCDKIGNFVFTIDVYYDIMKLYWKCERKTVSRRFYNGKKQVNN